jgi:hypothetical protein
MEHLYRKLCRDFKLVHQGLACDSSRRSRRRKLINNGTILRFWNGLSGSFRSSEPGFLGFLDLLQSCHGTLAEGGAVRQIGNVCDVAAILITIEHVNVVIFHHLAGQRQIVRFGDFQQLPD